jgi:hypothetical protein
MVKKPNQTPPIHPKQQQGFSMASIPDKFDADSKIKLFESQHIRSEWDAEAEKWWFSVLDVVAVLTDQPDYKKVRNYWKWLKNKLIAEGSQLVSATN